MTVNDLINADIFKTIKVGTSPEREITKPFNCDLLSIAMSKAPSDCAWITVMGNVNTLAVATLADVACIILAEGVLLDEAGAAKLESTDITVFSTDMPVFEASLAVNNLLNA
ncbi:MAG: hypothetical protein E7241_00560 [Lachnospiraceae bacterium]|jgi:hypothetical protein|nr:hypothetical protein [Lachnospiraceae bacterium]